VTEQGQPKGIFTDRDAIKAFAMGLSPSDEVRLASTMEHLEVIHMDDDVLKAIDIMTKRKIRHLPVKDDEGNIIGMLSILDASKAMSDLSK
ncbi:MAG: CBS domain-containing protein, partial [Candidatus Aramenus sulfurataquae]|nr:CBS domain-containing protein [Candidatus Aramenus sulfurataquae]